MKLFQATKIGKMSVKNRVVMSAMASNFANINGEVSEAIINYYTARASGGVGLIIVEAAAIDAKQGRQGFGQLNIDHYAYINGLNRLAQSIKNFGSRAFIQLFHAGRQGSHIFTEGEDLLAPSAIPCKISKEMPRALREAEIHDLINKYIFSAMIAEQAGFDGVELHAAHGYLINQFLSPNTNIRTDSFGGSLENRMKFLLEIIKGIKQETKKLLISVRLNIDDFLEGGLSSDESLLICQKIESMGIDLINCSCGTYESGLKSIEPVSYPEAWRIYLAEMVKKVVKIPVIGGGVIRDPLLANKIVEERKCDFIFLGRPLIADSDWVQKAIQGKYENIRPCIMCNKCIESNFKSKALSCTVNPNVGKETPSYFTALAKKRTAKAVVVGGGPAGMQVALSLDKQGYNVTLYEKNDRLGGQLHLAAKPPYKQRLAKLCTYLENEINKSEINLLLNYKVDAHLLENMTTEYIVLATGAKPAMIENDKFDTEICLGLEDVFNSTKSISEAKIIIIGGGSTACEIADYLVLKNNQLIIVEAKKAIAADMEKKNRRDLINRLDIAGVKKITSTLAISLSKTKGLLLEYENGDREYIKADYYVYATSFVSNDDLYKKLKAKKMNAFTIGDASEVRDIKAAIHEGAALALSISRIDEVIT